MPNRSPNLWIESYKINSPLVNSQGRLGLYGLLNLLQETAWMHAETLGFGMKGMEEQGRYWVITRQNLEMTTWPKFGEKVNIHTWVREPGVGFVTREFKIFTEEKKQIGACTTSWLALDRNTRQIIPSATLRNWKDICHSDATDLIAEKIRQETHYEKLAKFRVRNSDLDINDHVNNTKYAQWILDSIPHALHKSFRLTGYAVNFLAETHLGEVVLVEGDKKLDAVEALPPDSPSQGYSGFRGLRMADEKVLFVARLGWTSNLNASV